VLWASCCRSGEIGCSGDPGAGLADLFIAHRQPVLSAISVQDTDRQQRLLSGLVAALMPPPAGCLQRRARRTGTGLQAERAPPGAAAALLDLLLAVGSSAAEPRSVNWK